MHKPTLVFSPLRNAAPAQGGSVDLLLRVQAPDKPADIAVQHTPKRLALVVDRSGSMHGEPLDEAMKCVSHIAKHLTPKDDLCIVVYDSRVDVLMPIGPMLSQDAVQTAISQVISGGSTNLHGGWLAGAEQLEGGSDNAISRVLLLSDGQVNAGLRVQSEIEAQCTAWQAKGITTTTVGLGRNFNEDLMVGMAQAGGGQNYYGQRAEDLFDSFDEELSLLQAMYMRKLSVKLIPAAGVIVEMLSPAVQQADGTYRMTDLAWDSESWLAVRLHISPSAPGTMRDLLAVTLTGTTMDGNHVETSAPLLQLEALVPDDYAKLSVDELVERRLDELRFAKASTKLRELAKAGQVDAARTLLNELEAEFGKNKWLMAKIEQLRRLTEEDMEMMSKEVQYSAFRMSRRLASKSEVAFCMDETDLDMPSFLRKKESEGKGRTSR
jgi:Ca-activated chloride channel family protein